MQTTWGFAAAMVSQLAARVFGALDEGLMVDFLDLNLELLEAMGFDLDPFERMYGRNVTPCSCLWPAKLICQLNK